MKKLLAYTIFFLLCATANAQNDSLSVISRIMERTNKYVSAANEAIINKNYIYKTSLSSMSVGGLYNTQTKALCPQNGDGLKLLSISTTSLKKLSATTSIWGDASYKTGRIKNVNWNSTSSYDIIYPYILADTIGGDLNHESYSFSGGYSKELNKFIISAEGSFIAQHQYRQIDPRPRSITSDLSVNIGSGYKLNDTYILGLDVEGRLYRQSCSVDYYDELGIIGEYQMTGLGTYFARFSGDVTSLLYKGKGGNVALQLLSTNNQKWQATTGYNFFTFERIARTLNNLPLTTLDKTTVFAEISYREKSLKTDKSLKIKGNYQNHIGTENIVGDAATGIYPVIGKLSMYSRKKLSSAIEGNISMGNIYRSLWSITPHAVIDNEKEEYKQSTKKKEINNLTVVTNFSWNKKSNDYLFDASVSVNYRTCLNSELSLPIANMEKWLVNMLTYNYDMDRQTLTSCNISLASYKQIKNNIAVFAKIKFDMGAYQHLTDYVCNLEIGINF